MSYSCLGVYMCVLMHVCASVAVHVCFVIRLHVVALVCVCECVCGRARKYTTCISVEVFVPRLLRQHTHHHPLIDIVCVSIFSCHGRMNLHVVYVCVVFVLCDI